MSFSVALLVTVALAFPLQASPSESDSKISESPACPLYVAGSAIPAAHYEFLRQHGRNTLSYSQFQSGLTQFETPDGLVTYDRHLIKSLVLGDPLSSLSARGAVLDRYLSQHRDPFFCGITYPTAVALQERGFLINEMGVDTRIHIPSYTLEGPKKAKLRQALNKFKDSGYRLFEQTEHDVAVGSSAKEVSDEWQQGKIASGMKVRFLTRPIVYGNEQDVRKFYVMNPSGKIVAFYFFDPIYEAGQVIGYSTSFKRRLAEALTGLEEAVTVLAISQFREEGKTWLHLGMTPLSGIQDAEFRHSKSLHFALVSARKHADGIIYNFKGHEDFKHRFRGEESPLYFASRHEWNFHGVFATLKACGLSCPPRELGQIVTSMCKSLVKGARLNAVPKHPAE